MTNLEKGGATEKPTAKQRCKSNYILAGWAGVVACILGLAAFVQIPPEPNWSTCYVTRFEATTIECMMPESVHSQSCQRLHTTCDCGKRCSTVGACLILWVAKDYGLDADHNNSQMLYNNPDSLTHCWEAEETCPDGEDPRNRIRAFASAQDAGQQALATQNISCYEQNERLYSSKQDYLGTVVVLGIFSFFCLCVGCYAAFGIKV